MSVESDTQRYLADRFSSYPKETVEKFTNDIRGTIDRFKLETGTVDATIKTFCRWLEDEIKSDIFGSWLEDEIKNDLLGMKIQ